MTTHRRAVETAIENSIRRQKERGSKKTVFGHYWEIVNGVLVAVHEEADVIGNVLPTQGINHCLGVWLGAVAKPAGWYLSLYQNNVDPAANWTAANVVANAGESTSTTEGYTQATRPQFTPNAATSGHIDNVGNEARFTIATASTVDFNGLFLISDNVRGGGSGFLGSAAAMPLTRTLQNGDNYDVGYQVTITS